MATRPRHKTLLSSLIQTGYLPEELPPAITARHFSAYCENNFQHLGKGPLAKSYPTQFEKFSIPRENGNRRDLALVHPGAQLRLSMILVKNHNEIRSLIEKSRISLYGAEPDLANFRAFKGVSFKALDAKRSKVSQEKPFILVADISRFFYTIYTHSIPWAVLGKDKVKAKYMATKVKRTKAKHWTDELDQALQSCQARETFGIPVGPDTSRIVAEVLLSGVHGDPDFASAVNGSNGFRLVDDFFLGFDSEEQCVLALVALRNTLAKFNLQLNDDKTEIKASREIFTDRWRYELKRSTLSSRDWREEERLIRQAADLALYHSSKLRNAFPVKWLATGMLHTEFQSQNFKLALTTLLRFGRDFPACISLVSTFIINNKETCLSTDYGQLVEKWIRSVFRAHARNGHDFEVAWALVVCGALKIKVSTTDFGDYANSMSSVAFALLGLLNEKHLLSSPLSTFGWRREVKSGGLDSHHWLMFYESVLRAWTSDKVMNLAVKSHPLFGELLSKKVSFLDDAVFGDVQIMLDRRRLKRVLKNSSVQGAGRANISFSDIYDEMFEDFEDDDSFGIASL